MEYAGDVLFSGKQQEFNSRKEPGGDSKRGFLSSRSVKGLVLGGLAVSLGAMEKSAGKTAEVASDLRMQDVGIEPAVGTPQSFQDSSCIQGVVVGGLGSLVTENPLPLLVGLSRCLTKASAQQMIGNEFQVNTYTSGDQKHPCASVLSNGNFIVVWDSYLQDGSYSGIYGQLFDGNANRIGNEFQANTFTPNDQNHPRSVKFNNGNFVIVWQSWDQDNSFFGAYGQLFDNNANKIGNEFQINTYTTDSQYDPSVSSFTNDNFVVAWVSEFQDGSDHGVYGQLFDENANRIGSEFQINTYTNNTQDYPHVITFSNGNFIVAWDSNWQDGSVLGVYGQLFDENATNIENEFQVNIPIQIGKSI